MRTTSTKPREVKLLACPDPSCRRVSRIDASAFHDSKGRAWCSGPIGDGHRKVKCVPVRFVEKANDEVAA